MKKVQIILMLIIICLLFVQCDDNKYITWANIGGTYFVNNSQQKITLKNDTYSGFLKPTVLYPNQKKLAGNGATVYKPEKYGKYIPFFPMSTVGDYLKVTYNDTIEITYYCTDTIGRSPYNIKEFRFVSDSALYYYIFTEEDYQNALKQQENTVQQTTQ